MPCRQRDLLLVPIPFSDLASAKIRPVLVLSNDLYYQDGPDILVAAITSNTTARSFMVPIDTPQLEEGTMKRASVVRADKIFNIDQAIALRRFGRASSEVLEDVRRAIGILLAT